MNKEILLRGRPFLYLLCILTTFFVFFKNWLLKKNVDFWFLTIGHLLVFAITMLSFYILIRSLKNKNTHAFVRAVNGSFVLKFFVLAIGAFIYIYQAKQISKPALFGCMGIYFLYSFLEIYILTKLLREKKDA